MPEAVPALIVGLGAGFQAASGLFFSAFLRGFVSTFILGLLARQLEKDPQNPAFASRTMTMRQPDGPRQVIYGKVRVGGQLTYARAGDRNATIATVTRTNPDGSKTTHTITAIQRTLALVVTFTGHEVNSIDSVWFNSEALTLDGSGNVTVGTFAGQATVIKRLGAASETAFAELISFPGSGWTANHLQTGCAKVLCLLAKNYDVYPQGAPNITAVIQGKKVYDPRSGLTVWSDNPALCLADYLCTSRVNGGPGAVYASEIDETLLITAASICDESVSLRAGGTEKRYTCNGAFIDESVWCCKLSQELRI